MHGTVSLHANFIAILVLENPLMFRYMICLISTAEVYQIGEKIGELDTHESKEICRCVYLKDDEHAIPGFYRILVNHSRIGQE